MAKNDGGQAFPVEYDGRNSWKDLVRMGKQGMTMRQAYKMAALQALLLSNVTYIPTDRRIKAIAEDAGKLADAMIAEDEEAAKA